MLFLLINLLLTPDFVDPEKLLEAISERQQQLVSLKASFQQVKESVFFTKAEKTQGVLYYKAPDKVRWEFHNPHALVILIRDDVLELYYPEEKRLERAKIKNIREKIFKYLTATAPLKKLKQHFMMRIRDNKKKYYYIVELQPLTFRIKKYLVDLKIHFDKNLLLPIKIAYTEKDGDHTEIKFSNFQVDKPMEDSLFIIPEDDDLTIQTFHFSQ